MPAATREKASARSVGSAVAVGVATVGAWIAVAAGVVLAVFALTGQLMPEAPVRIGPAAPAWSEEVLPCVQGWSVDGISGCEPAARPDVWPGGSALPVQHPGGLVVSSSDVPPPTALLATAPVWGWFLAAGATVLILIPVVRGTAAGRPFERGNTRRLTSAAAVIAGAWIVVSAGPTLAAPAVIDAVTATRLATSGSEVLRLPAGWLVPDHRITWWPIVVALLIAVLAAATRSGTRLAADAEGLV